MSETTAVLTWEEMSGQRGEGGFAYVGNEFMVLVRGANWWVFSGGKVAAINCASDHATAKSQAECWIVEREGRLPAPATDGGGWIACKDRMPENDDDVEVITHGYYVQDRWIARDTVVTHWRPLPVDPHKDAACLFSGRYRPTVEQARTAARHVAGCAECRAKLEAKGGA